LHRNPGLALAVNFVGMIAGNLTGALAVGGIPNNSPHRFCQPLCYKPGFRFVACQPVGDGVSVNTFVAGVNVRRVKVIFGFGVALRAFRYLRPRLALFFLGVCGLFLFYLSPSFSR